MHSAPIIEKLIRIKMTYQQHLDPYRFKSALATIGLSAKQLAKKNPGRVPKNMIFDHI